MPSRDNTKSSGILLGVSSLPSKYGIGAFDKEAYRFVDFLCESRQRYWQILPLCPVGKGNSPYSSYSAFAGEILYIDLDELYREGLIYNIPQPDFSINVDYKAVKKFKLPLLREAAESFDSNKKDYLRFCEIHKEWLQNYAEFMALKEVYGNAPFTEWEDGVKYRLPDALEKFRTQNCDKIDFYKITQYFFYCQYKKLKGYANKRGIKIIGDIPFYVSPDSADVWANPDCFCLNRDMTPRLIAGVPPDLFSDDGQLWGNPIYDWEYQRKDNYGWWQKRLSHNAELYDVLRIDHFRAFADYYAVENGAKDAKNGKWIKGEGAEFWNTVKPSIRECEIIAEDLGVETPEVQALIEKTGFPNMKILQFAFDSDLKDPFLPENFGENCVCYTGTHDNNTTLGWYREADLKERLLFEKLTSDIKEDFPVLRLIAFGMLSNAKTVIIPMQDYMELDSLHRMNTPGKEDGNWQWRFCPEDLNTTLSDTVKRLTKGRN